MKKESVQEEFSSTSKKDFNEERENRTVKQNKNLWIKIDLEKGKVTGNLGSGNQNLSRKICNTPAKMECCLEDKLPVKVNFEGWDEGWVNCGLVGKKWENGKWLEMARKECIYKCIMP